jgi:hypothetical protein
MTSKEENTQKAVSSNSQKENREKPIAKKAKKPSDSYTGVNYPQSVFSGVRKTVGFKCDSGLYEEFKRVAQAKMGSVCKPLEAFEIAVLALNKEQVNFGTTVNIENLNILRELRTRRKGVADKCGFAKCDNPAITEGIWQDKKVFPLCVEHLLEAINNPKNWRLS